MGSQGCQYNLPISRFLIASAKSLLPCVVITFSKELGHGHVWHGDEGAEHYFAYHTK